MDFDSFIKRRKQATPFHRTDVGMRAVEEEVHGVLEESVEEKVEVAYEEKNGTQKKSKKTKEIKENTPEENRKEISTGSQESIQNAVGKAEEERSGSSGSSVGEDAYPVVDKEEVYKTFVKIAEKKCQLNAKLKNLKKENLDSVGVVAKESASLAQQDQQIINLQKELKETKELLMLLDRKEDEKEKAVGSRNPVNAVSREEISVGVVSVGKDIHYEDLAAKAYELFKEQTFLNDSVEGSEGGEKKEVSLSSIAIARSKAESFLDGLTNVNSIKHELELIRAEEHGFKRTDELKILNSLRRACEVSAHLCEKEITFQQKLYEDISNRVYGGEQLTDSDMCLMREIKINISENIDEMTKIIRSADSLIKLERRSGNKSFGQRKIKPMAVNYISGLMDTQRKELGYDMDGAGGPGGVHPDRYNRYREKGGLRKIDSATLQDMVKEMEEKLR